MLSEYTRFDAVYLKLLVSLLQPATTPSFLLIEQSYIQVRSRRELTSITDICGDDTTSGKADSSCLRAYTHGTREETVSTILSPLHRDFGTLGL